LLSDIKKEVFMTIYFSPSQPGFYDDSIFPLENIPTDKIELTPEQHEILMLGQSEGKLISVDQTGTVIADFAVISQEQKLKMLIDTIQLYLNEKAQEKGYDDIRSAALRAAYVGPFQSEGLAFAQWMDACWEYGYQVKADVENNVRTIPETSELILELPVLVL
jgi:hypothetical protein